jgi:hypothetical protein
VGTKLKRYYIWGYEKKEIEYIALNGLCQYPCSETTEGLLAKVLSMQSMLKLHKEVTVNRVLVWHLEASLFSLRTEADMCQNARTDAIGHGSQGHYATGNCFQVLQ